MLRLRYVDFWLSKDAALADRLPDYYPVTARGCWTQ